MRIFIALDIDDAIRTRLETFLNGARGFAPEARWVRPESMHVTLKFVGEKSAETVEDIKQALGSIRGSAIEVSFCGYGFFPTAKAPRVFWIGIQAGPQLGALAKAVDETTARLDVPREEHEFSPHLTLARRGSGAPHLPEPELHKPELHKPELRKLELHKNDRANPVFQRLQARLEAMPELEFGTMTAREFFLYQSQLMPGGARYTKIAGFELR